MLDEIRIRSGSSLGRWISIAAHCLALGFMIAAAHHAWQLRPVVGRGGEQSTVLYWEDSVGSGSLHSHSMKRSAAKAKPQAAVTPQPTDQPTSVALQTAEPEFASSAGSSTSRSQGTGVGDGSQNATPAFPVYSPSPHIERSLLPRIDENVVIDVNVSAMGDVLDEKLVHGLGTNVDQTILNTVKSWKFHPATVDGNAVASVAELVFPLGQKWRG